MSRALSKIFERLPKYFVFNQKLQKMGNISLLLPCASDSVNPFDSLLYLPASYGNNNESLGFIEFGSVNPVTHHAPRHQK